MQNLNDASNNVLGNAIVLVIGKSPLRAKFTPCFQAKELYQIRESQLKDTKAIYFDKADVYYDIESRREKVKIREKADAENDEEMYYDEEAEPPDKRESAFEALEQKLNRLDSLLNKNDFAELLAADLVKKVELLEGHFERAGKTKNRRLLFEAALVKDFIERECLGGGHDKK